ncbi:MULTISPECIES: transglutaminase family protein [unclassified Methylobacterium]|uniref:transglutaminase-like domain-containing protein n=1 Tax=unclassified Methylobacterium TaxID=2615210 RepID=UPI0011C1E333|nr:MULTISPECIES: transglutaminase family protein [unclassified Methylobacterium]MCJ2118427.1 transglutaminase family protein [Methylobacterium sp. J-001]QEE41599.1 transglutaminase family protein [Methylobacterium sp. WL1]TXN57235.1 transglutaminase family protein [Methylobacterium sp. WL2]
MRIRTGYTIGYDTFGPTPIIYQLDVHPSRAHDLLSSDAMRVDPPVPMRKYTDTFGNTCVRLLSPGGRVTVSADFLIHDSGEPDAYAPDARQIPVQDLPDEVLIYLLGSRYCDTDKLAGTAWSLFGGAPEGWARVAAIVTWAHERIRFDYQLADATRSAFDGFNQRVGVCRDFAHLAVTLCRCMNFPARYCTGYLGDIGVPVDPNPMDFSAWFEVFLDGPEGPRWYTFDARHNARRIGRIVIARGRDATDVAISTSFGTALLAQFDVHTVEVADEATTEPHSGARSPASSEA